MTSVSAAPARSMLAPSIDHLVVAWQNPISRAISPVGVLTRTDGGYTFEYNDDAPKVVGFDPLLGFPDMHRRYVSPRLFPLFSQRVMGSRRPDFAEFMEMLGVPVDADPLTVLGRSAGSRVGDSIYLFRAPEVDDSGHARSVFFVHGVRHLPGASELIDGLRVGDRLALVPEPDNAANRKALLISLPDDRPIGWVPDLWLDLVHDLMTADPPEVRVVQVNERTAPPNLRVLVELEGHVPVDRWREIARRLGLAERL